MTLEDIEELKPIVCNMSPIPKEVGDNTVLNLYANFPKLRPILEREELLFIELFTRWEKNEVLPWMLLQSTQKRRRRGVCSWVNVGEKPL